MPTIKSILLNPDIFIPLISFTGLLIITIFIRRIFYKNFEININRRELTLFEILLNKKGQYISKSHLVDTQYGVGADVNTNAIEISISRLRKILSNYNINITTARGIGYMMDDLANE